MTVQTLEPIIAAHGFFRALDPQYIAIITGCASNVRFRAGEIVFSEGQPADAFFLIRSGRVALEIDVPGRGARIIQTMEEGDVLGWSWLFPPYRWAFTARTTEPVRAIAMDARCLRGKCEADPRMGYELMKRFAGVMMERLQATRLQLLDMYGTP
jgi:CRP/FNR family transcriptional regulator, cyclic AMP receptor protein